MGIEPPLIERAYGEFYGGSHIDTGFGGLGQVGWSVGPHSFPYELRYLKIKILVSKDITIQRSHMYYGGLVHRSITPWKCLS